MEKCRCSICNAYRIKWWLVRNNSSTMTSTCKNYNNTRYINIKVWWITWENFSFIDVSVKHFLSNLFFRYWLYAAIKFKCLIVTNDEMRDHTFQLLGNDFFPRWKERHQVSKASPKRTLVVNRLFKLYFSCLMLSIL